MSCSDYANRLSSGGGVHGSREDRRMNDAKQHGSADVVWGGKHTLWYCTLSSACIVV